MAVSDRLGIAVGALVVGGLAGALAVAQGGDSAAADADPASERTPTAYPIRGSGEADAPGPLQVGASEAAGDSEDADSGKREVQLVDGQRLDVELVRVTEEGLVVRLVGNPLQLPWDLVTARDFLSERQALLDRQDGDSLLEYIDWCEQAGLTAEHAEAVEDYTLLTGKSPFSEVVERDPEDDQPEGDDTPPARPREQPDRGEDRPDAVVTAERIAFSYTGDESLKPTVEDYLSNRSLKTVTRKQDATLELDFRLTTVKEATFYGDVVHGWYKAEATARLLNAEGELMAEESFASGDMYSAKKNARADGQGQARDVVWDGLERWLDRKLQVGKPEAEAADAED